MSLLALACQWSQRALPALTWRALLGTSTQMDKRSTWSLMALSCNLRSAESLTTVPGSSSGMVKRLASSSVNRPGESGDFLI